MNSTEEAPTDRRASPQAIGSAAPTLERGSRLYRWVKDWWRGLLVLGVTLLLHIVAVNAVPLPAIGPASWEYMPHVQRLRTALSLESREMEALFHPLRTLEELDQAYPPLLGVVSALWMKGQPVHLDPFIWCSLLNLPFLLLLAASSGALAGHFRRQAAPLAFTLTLLEPGITLPSRRLYFDLPMSAMVTLAAVALFTCRGSKRAVLALLFTTGALFFKWSAALYLIPFWSMAVYTSSREGARRDVLLLGASLAGVVGLSLPLALRPEGSFAHHLEAGAGVEALATAGTALHFYLKALLEAGTGVSLGLLMGVTWLAFLTRALIRAVKVPAVERRSRGLERGNAVEVGGGLRAVWLFCLTVGPVIAWLAGAVSVRDGRYLMPLLPIFAMLTAVLVEALPAKTKAAASWLLVVTGLGQALFVDFLQPASPPLSSPNLGADLRIQVSWEEAWWTGLRATRPSPRADYEVLYAQVLELLPLQSRLALVGTEGRAPVHAWQYVSLSHAPATLALSGDFRSEDLEALFPLEQHDALLIFTPSREKKANVSLPERLEGCILLGKVGNDAVGGTLFLTPRRAPEN